MKKYRIKFYREELYLAEVYADSVEEAKKMLSSNRQVWMQEVKGSEPTDEIVSIDEVEKPKEVTA